MSAYDQARFWAGVLFARVPHKVRRVLGLVGLALVMFWLFGLGVIVGAGQATWRVLAGVFVWQAVGMLLLYQMPRKKKEVADHE